MALKMNFSNSAEAVLDTPLLDTAPDWYFSEPDGGQYESPPPEWTEADGSYMSFQVSDLAQANRFAHLQGQLDRAQPVTLTHASLPGEFEIAHVNFRNGKLFEVFRAQDGTTAKAWPAGTKVGANVTAGMLSSFLQRDDLRDYPAVNELGAMDLTPGLVIPEGQRPPMQGSNSVGFDARSTRNNVFKMGAYSLVEKTRARKQEPDGPYYGNGQDRNFAFETVGQSVPVDIGATQQWAAFGSYADGAVVVPAVANGYQYWLDLAHELMSGVGYLSTGITPAFGTSAAAANDGDEWRGYWVPTALPINLVNTLDYPLVVTEVGFISDYMMSDPSTVPVISIGDENSDTRYASAVALNQLSADGVSVHRIPIAVGGLASNQIRFRVDTQGAGTQIRGRFYWRGFFVG